MEKHMKIKKFFAMLALFVGISFAGTTKLKNVEAHWLANIGGTKEDHVQNFIEDMIVNYNHDLQFPRPMVLTSSAWDEAGHSYGAYHNGKTIGKAEWWRDIIYSDTATFKQDKCWIVNFWGRASFYRRSYIGHVGPPPTGASAPYVKCADGSAIRTVTDPTALAFDTSGNILVSDNGPDQNIKIFSKSRQLLRTFGDSGGVFAQSKKDPKIIPGTAGTYRFWGIRGLGVDTAGNVYVGMSGIPEQSMGGADIRVFSAKDSSLLWKLQGLSFVNTGDADPGTDGNIISLNAKRFSMDYTKKPGKSWELKSVTLDPFKYKYDPRITNSWESVWSRVVGGVRYLYLGNMYGSAIIIIRFEPGTEIGIPVAYFCTYGDVQETPWVASDSLPQWERSETNKRKRWYWVDRNGDAIPQKSEFTVYDNWNGYSQGLDVDDSGNIWLAGSGKISEYFKAGGITKFTFGKQSKGIPQFSPDSIKRYEIPFEEDGRSLVVRLKYIASKDIMYLGSGADAWRTKSVYRYDNYSDSTKRKLVSVSDLGFDNNGSDVHLDIGTSAMTLPYSFTADEDYIYVAYLDNGRYSRVRGEVTVYNALTGAPVGYTQPDSGLGYFFGTTDLVNGINVFTQKSGHRLIMIEEDGAGKVVVYRWLPDSNNVDTAETDTVKIVTPLSAPTNLQATAGDKSAELSWSQVTGANSYNLYRVVTTTRDSLLFTTIDTVATINALRNGTTYKFKVVAINADTQSTASTIVSVKPVTPLPGMTTLGNIISSKVVLNWPAAPYATKYKVIQVKDGVTTTLITTTKLTYSITLASGSTYSFNIVSVNTSGESAPSNVISITAP